MKDFLTIEMTFSEYHLIFPKIMSIILVAILILMAVLNLIKRVKEGKLTDFRFKFFINNYDKVKLYGTIILLVVYVFVLDLIGFLPASILFVFLITLLFIGNYKRKSMIISLANALTTSVIVWYVFGYMFDITLP